MGSAFACRSCKKSSDNNVKREKVVVSELNKSQSSNISESTTSRHSVTEILDDSFKAEITEAIDEYMVSVPTNYQTEHDRIVNEMSRLAPEPYLGLLFSEYPDINGLTVNEMARRLVLSNSSKQQLTDQINERIESSFQFRTADWTSTARETARPAVKTFIEKLVNDAFNHIQLA